MLAGMKCYGLIGFPLSHSFSKRYFTDKFKREQIADCIYENFPIENISLFPQLIDDNKNLLGLNVTIPYKQPVISYLDEVDGDIPSIGAVNTIKIKRHGDKVHLKGYNTDVYGFSTSLLPHVRADYKSALLLGTGGASKAVAYVLAKMGFEITYISRTPKQSNQISYAQITPQIIESCQIIVNTSPVGMYPDTSKCPDIPYEHLTPNHVLFDLIYNPEETLFLTKGKEKGATVINGMKMLHLQAEKAWEIWNSDL